MIKIIKYINNENPKFYYGKKCGYSLINNNCDGYDLYFITNKKLKNDNRTINEIDFYFRYNKNHNKYILLLSEKKIPTSKYNFRILATTNKDILNTSKDIDIIDIDIIKEYVISEGKIRKAKLKIQYIKKRNYIL